MYAFIWNVATSAQCREFLAELSMQMPVLIWSLSFAFVEQKWIKTYSVQTEILQMMDVVELDKFACFSVITSIILVLLLCGFSVEQWN